MSESVNGCTDAWTDAEKPARLPSYKFTKSLGSGELKIKALESSQHYPSLFKMIKES